MPQEISIAIGLLTALALWLATKHTVALRHRANQIRIAAAGATSIGKVVAIQRPFMLDDCTRLYFDFVPSGAQAPVRACHIAPAPQEGAPALPAHGATVTVRYLPKRPRRAVIGQLVTQ